jgi:hypothetical protein
MHEVIQKLHEGLDLLKTKLDAVNKRDMSLTDRETNVTERERVADMRDEALNIREAQIQPIEHINEVKKQQDEDTRILSDQKAEFTEEKLKFTRYMAEQNEAIKSNINANKIESDRLIALSEELTALKENYKKEVLAELAKK